MNRVKTLIHVHTDYSFDSDISLETLAWSVANERVGCIAVTDHDTIEGARRLRAMTEARVIVGEEISAREGHLIGLFLQEGVRPGMSAWDTAMAIREQGGLVLAPHPFVRLFGCGLGQTVEQIAELIDAVEINNAQNILTRPDREADHFAQRAGLIRYVGADTHRTGFIAPCYQTMRDFTGPADFLDALAAAELHAGCHSPGYHAAMGYHVVRSLLGYGPPPGFGANARPELERIPAAWTSDVHRA